MFASHCHFGNFKKAVQGLCLAAAVVLCCVWGLSPARAEQTEERRIVRVGYYISPGFQDYDADAGEYNGSGYEYLIALQQYTNWTYEFVPVTFHTGVQMLMDGELDLMNNVSITEERKAKLSFSDYASGSNYACLMVSAENEEYAFNDYASFDAMRVGVMTGSIYSSYFEAFCQEHAIHPQVVYYADEDAMDAGMASGEIDTRLVSSSYHDGSREVARFAPMDYYFAVPADRKELLQELNDAMVALQIDLPNLQRDLTAKYEKQTVDASPVLSAEEKQYVAEHPNVTVAVSGAWYPIFYFDDNGDLSGPLAKLYGIIEEATGLHFQPVLYDSYTDSLEAVKAGEVDAIVEFPYDFLYAAKWNVQLSEQVNGIETYCILNEGTGMEDIRTIAFHGEPYMESCIVQRYGSSVNYVTYDNVDKAVEAVLNGEADATFVNYYSSTKFQNQGRYLSLKYVLVPSLEYDFAIGVSQAAGSCLKSLISKGLHSIASDDVEDMFRQSALMGHIPDVQLQFYQNPTVFLLGAVILTAMLVLTLAFALYSRSMRRANAKLASANQAKSLFLSRMSHDMRTPMNGILGLVTLMQDMDASAQIKEYLHQIQMSGKYLLNLINDTLDVNKIEANRLELHPVPTDAEKITRNIYENARILASEKGVTLTVERLEPQKLTPVLLLLDEGRVEQLFMNLISNAVKFTPAGGQVHVTMERLETADTFIVDRYQVQDTGIGMSQEFMQHMFEPFSQEGRTETERESGTGLGLPIVHSLVGLMGGDIQVASAQDEGTTFTVTLRFQRYLGPELAEEAPAEPERLTRLLTGKHVLLCEDHPLNRQIAVKMLEKMDMHVSTAENGQIGCDMFASAPAGTYDVILMDIRMPVMNGLDATRAIRAMKRPDAAVIPIVAMTANAYDEDIQNCKQAGMNEHVAKPVDVRRLYAVLADQLERVAGQGK